MPDITVPLEALGKPAAPAPRMNFAIVNGQQVPIEDEPAAPSTLSVPLSALGKPQAAPAPADDQDVGPLALISHFWKQTNPIQGGQLLPFPKALGGSGTDHPLALDPERGWAPNFAVQMQDVKRKGDEAWAKGDHVGAAAHYLYSILPIIGPALDEAGDEGRSGKWMAMLGDALGIGATVASTGKAILGGGPEIPSGGTLRKPPPGPVNPRAGTLTAQELAANALADERGIPLNASARTGNRWALAAEKRVANSMGGETVAEDTLAAQREGLKRVGTELADEGRPGPVSREQAGNGVQQSITDTIESLRGSQNQAYGKVREIEALPQNEETVQTAKLGSTGYRRILGKLSQGWKDESGAKVTVRPTHAELYTMRQIEAELDSQQYQQGRNVEHGSEYHSDTRYARGAANADVYKDIQQEARTSSMTGAEMRAGIAETLETGNWNSASRAAYKVAQKRVQNAAGGVGPGPRLLDDAPILGKAEKVALPVDIGPVKDALEGLHERLAREAEVAPLMGGKAEAFRALDRIMSGPDHVSLSTADAARGDLLSIARTDDPMFRTAGQGAASKAAAALDEAIQAKAATVDGVQQGLEAGRAATRAKYDVGAIRDLLPEGAVKAFKKLTAPNDENVEILRKVQQVAPEKMADLGRAKLQQFLDLATERGRFQHADKLYAEWNKLGPETKKILFENPQQVADLDRFFLLAKRLAENPNPSGTAHTMTVFNFASQPVMYGIAKLLYTPAGVEALTDFMRSGSKTAAAAGRGATVAGRAVSTSASRAAALSRLAIVARGEGVDLGLAASRDDQQ